MNAATNDLIDRFMESRQTNKSRRMNIAEKKSKVDFTEDIMGISSPMQVKDRPLLPVDFPIIKREECSNKMEVQEEY